MIKNMGSTDKIIRLAVAAVILLLYALDKISGTLAIVLGVVAVIFAVTSLINFCPLYKVLGINTNKEGN